MLKKIINAIIGPLGYEMARKKKRADGLASLYRQALQHLLVGDRQIAIAQVGANDGRINDQIYDFVMANKQRTKIILIEPQVNVLPYLTENYKEHPGATVVNCAVGPQGALTLYRLNPEHYDRFVKRYLKDSPSYRVPTGFTSSIREHVVKHVRGNLPAGISVDEAIEEISVPCMPLKNVLQANGWGTAVDLLQVDVEGMDDQVIYECSVNEMRPAFINFEYRHLSPEKFARLDHYLASEGYLTVRYNGANALAIRAVVSR